MEVSWNQNEVSINMKGGTPLSVEFDKLNLKDISSDASLNVSINNVLSTRIKTVDCHYSISSNRVLTKLHIVNYQHL